MTADVLDPDPSVTTSEGPQVLYRFFDALGELLYVGITNNPGARWTQHGKSKSWWPEVADVRAEVYPDRAAVRRAEKLAIETESPRYNVQHNRRRAHAATASPAKRVPASFDAYIKRIVDEAPPLTRGQRDRLYVLLNGSPETFRFSRGDTIAVKLNHTIDYEGSTTRRCYMGAVITCDAYGFVAVDYNPVEGSFGPEQRHIRLADVVECSALAQRLTFAQKIAAGYHASADVFDMDPLLEFCLTHDPSLGGAA